MACRRKTKHPSTVLDLVRFPTSTRTYFIYGERQYISRKLLTRKTHIKLIFVFFISINVGFYGFLYEMYIVYLTNKKPKKAKRKFIVFGGYD